MNNFDHAMAIISIDDLMDICKENSHGHGFVTFALTVGLIGAGIGIRSLIKRVDKLEERCKELECAKVPDDVDDIFDDLEDE